MKKENICIIGMGYVGLTLALVLLDDGFVVYGIEKNSKVLKSLKQGIPHFFEKGVDLLLKKYFNDRFFLFPSIPKNKEIDVFIITVGTPINKKNKNPMLKHLIEATKDVKTNLEDGQLVILRSTVPIGATRELVFPILKRSGKNFYLAFCPERTTEGVALKELKELPQIIGGLNEESVEKAMSVFRRVTPTVVVVASLENAEMNKMLDNAYRDLTFACANEIALIAKKLGLDGYELISAGNLGYPRTNIPVPGFVGGACLEKDPWIFIDAVFKKTGYMPKLIKTAREINENLPSHVARRIEEFLLDKNINIEIAKIFISGFAFKGRPDTDDLRGSPTLDLIDELIKRNIKNIYGHDFIVSFKEIEKLGVQPVKIEEGFRDTDVVVFMNNHPFYENLNLENLLMMMKKGGLFFDGWHIYEPQSVKELNHIIYEGLGV